MTDRSEFERQVAQRVAAERFAEKAQRIAADGTREDPDFLNKAAMIDAQPKPKAPPAPLPRSAHWPEGSDEKRVTEDFFAMMKRRAERR